MTGKAAEPPNSLEHKSSGSLSSHRLPAASDPQQYKVLPSDPAAKAVGDIIGSDPQEGKGTIAAEESQEKEPLSPEDSPEYASGIKLLLIFVALLLSMFLVALDLTIVATAIPRITDEFHSLDQVGWYGSAFFLTLAAFQSPWGKGYKYFPLKLTFLLSIFIFEIGSLICGLSNSSITLIIGRAITGLGGAGIVGGCYIIIAYIVPPAKAPTYIGLLGGVFSCASVAGPLLGGVFTDKLSWRWCFFINLPIGGAALLILIFFFHTPANAKPIKVAWLEILLQMDIPGVLTITAGLICYILALEWGGVTKPWNSPDVIGTLVGWISLTTIFVVIQYWQGERALLVTRIIKQRTIAACCAFIFLLNSANFLLIYYLPIYFQAIENASPSQSGVRNLPLILASSIFVILGGGLVGRVGHFQPFLLVGSLFVTIGAGLLYTLDINTTAGKYIGYQIVVGVGIGISIQVSVIASQAFSDLADIPLVTAVVLFFQLVSGALAVSAAQSIFTNRLLASLPLYAPGVVPAQVLAAGATEIRTVFDASQIDGILQSYLAGLKAAWAMGIGLAGLAVLASLLPERKSIKGIAVAAGVA